ncbi:hypothetical protein HBA54_04120 [Pelagibius litoralis]|uniref:Uncharacterized protein n=1 Tax=Pelagibius litoralis TaxID=374515 RepID=A0A967CAL9_9PROT|nr:hypothetical protein [Pelagibius litoralis]NIA67768.1 hypothetical protein [Pelagibius litoralis]
MAGRFTFPIQSAFDNDGTPGAGAKLYFYISGTSTALDTFSDDALSVANTNPVDADSAGRFPAIFLSDQDYKVILRTSEGVTLWTADPVRAAEPTSTTVISKSTTYTVTSADNGRLIKADATAGAFTITLPPAATAGNGFEVTVKKVDSSANAVTLDADGSETIDGGTDISLPNQHDAVQVRSDGTAWQVIVQPFGSENIPLGLGFISGFVLSNNTTDAEHDIDISPGAARNDADGGNIVLSSVTVKRLDAAWAVGSGNGGLDTGAVAVDTWYHLFAIRRSDTGVVDVLFSASPTAPTLPGGYDQKRRIGAVLTDSSSNILPFLQRPGGFFEWVTPILDANDGSPTATNEGELYTISVPPSALAHISAGANSADTAGVAYFRASDITNDIPVDFGGLPLHNAGIAVGGATVTARASDLWVWTDSSSQIRASVDAASTDLTIMAKGWFDPRGQDA